MFDIAKDNEKYEAAPIVEFSQMTNLRKAYEAACNPQAVPKGWVLEFGVAEGGTMRMLREIWPSDVQIFGFDSFKGLPEGHGSFCQEGQFALESPLVLNLPNTFLIVGLFEDTLDQWAKNHPGSIKFAHIDCDIYSSTATVFTKLRDRFVSGTVIAFDEYKMYGGWEEREYKAFGEFIDATGFDYTYICRGDQQERAVVQLL